MSVPIPPAEVLGELVVLFLVTLPLGALVLRLAERFLGRTLSLTVTERLVVSFYIVGGLLFLIASVPIPWYGLPTVVGLLVAGGIGYAVLSIRDRGSGLRQVVRFGGTPVGILLLLGTLVLLWIEISPIWNLPLSNPFDGSIQSIYANLLITDHTAPWTMAPYATWGVGYPLSTAVWMTVPALLFGWPIARIPLLLLPLFLSLTIPAAYCWGIRLSNPGSREAQVLGPLFAAFFGLVASWPRLWVGGSYDFGFSLPLLLILLGWARPFVEGAPKPWKEVVCFGLLLGVLAALNAAAAQFLVLILIGYVAVFHSRSSGSLRSWFLRIVAVAGIGLLWVVRTLIGYAAWFSYPGQVLQETGNPPYVAPPVGYAWSLGLVQGELDPFVPGKPKLSPFPVLALELQVLLAVGLALLFLGYVVRSGKVRRVLPGRAAESISVGLILAFLFTCLLIVPLLPRSPFPYADKLSSLNEVSILLFIFFGLVALLPLASAVILLDRRKRADPGTELEAIPASIHPPSPGSPPPRRNPVRMHSRRLVSVALVLVIIVPLGSGAVLTVWGVPGYVQDKTLSTGNATQQDVSALQWAGANLPSCSRVLVAPGSAGQFLPEFAHVGLVYPMLPVPVNSTYHAVVGDLIQGSYNGSTRSALLLLNITEIMGTSETFGGYLPFNLTGILESPAPDFSVLFHEGDATILEFLPGASPMKCLA